MQEMGRLRCGDGLCNGRRFKQINDVRVYAIITQGSAS
jgi:hypothetical protein